MIVLTVETNGYTKFLKISDKLEEERPVRGLEAEHQLSKYLMPVDSEIKLRLFKIYIDQLCLSVMHRKKELMTCFIAKVQQVVEETKDALLVKFHVGYLQVDNQSDPLPSYPVMLKPREMWYDGGKIKVQHEENERDRQLREELGLDGFTAANARVFQAEVIVSKRLTTTKLLYIERIAFLVQTL